MKVIFNKGAAVTLVFFSLVACGDDDGSVDAGPGMDAAIDAFADDAPATDAAVDAIACEAVANTPAYVFEREGVSTASYAGQSFRHLLIDRLSGFIGGLSDRIDADGAGRFDEKEELLASFDFYFRFDGAANGMEPHGLQTEPESAQTLWDDIASGRNLLDKTAGQDDSTDHADWDDGAFAGWTTFDGEAVTSPVQLIDSLLGALADNGVARANGEQPRGPNDEALPVYVTPEGLDLQQLLQKVLLMSVTFSQATDDYLDDDVDGKGLLTSNALGEDAYTPLEHAWDEAFGYFGAPADHPDYTADELASSGDGRADWQGAHDTNADCRIDLVSEYAWGAVVNAAKRDRGSTTGTTFGTDAFEAFLAGRALIAGADGALDEGTLAMLRTHRDAAVRNWENAIAATVVHYINDVLADMDAMGTDDYSFTDHAKHWSELKGFAIGLQFNPRSPLHAGAGEATQFLVLHGYLGDLPVLEAAGEEALAAYASALADARTLLQDAYGFDPADVAAW